MSETPPQWQYWSFSKVATARAGFRGPSLDSGLQEAVEEANRAGTEGWEMINFTTQWVAGERHTAAYWRVACIMKRRRLS